MIEINLLPEELIIKPKLQGSGFSFEPKMLLLVVPLILAVLILFHGFLGAVIIAKNIKMGALNKKWEALEPERKKLQEYKKEFSVFSQDALAIKQIGDQRIAWAQKLNTLSLCLPSGVWLNEVSVSPKELTILGSVISLGKEEMALIKRLMDNLKADPLFSRDFNSLELSSVLRKTAGGYDFVDFSLSASLKAR